MKQTIYLVILLIVSLFSGPLVISVIAVDNNSSESINEERRIYDFNKCHGAGCPYTASWLVHVNLLKKAHWWLDSTKMEAASFIIFDKAHFKFQVGDPDAYYVHHMSMFEHVLHKRYGFDVAKNSTLVMSKAAFNGECGRLQASPSREYLAIIPFYGGLPPNVTAGLSVKSIGQGNSLVDAGTKALQCMATLCSTLKYFGQAVLGVVRDEDKTLILKMLDQVDPDIRRRTHVIQFEMNKPAHLPFHMIAWSQVYVQEYNCRGKEYYPKAAGATHQPYWSKKSDSYATSDVFGSDSDALRVCNVDFSKHQHGTAIKVKYHRKSAQHRQKDHDTDRTLYQDPVFDVEKQLDSNGNAVNYYHPIRYVYYTECDQVVKFDSDQTFHAISAATNESTFFVGRRREKAFDSEASDYLGSLNTWRNCGQPGYSLNWPIDTVVRQSS